MHITDLAVPLTIGGILLCGLIRRVDVAEEFTAGAKDGLRTAAELIPMLVLLMTAVGMFTSSGAAELLARLLSPLAERVGFPQECLHLAMIRPFSGSGALAAVGELFDRVSPDSFAGRVASVLMSSTETTFYTIAVYSAALGKKPDARVFIAAAAADITGFVLSSLTVRLFMF